MSVVPIFSLLTAVVACETARAASTKINELKHALAPRDLHELRGDAELSGWLEICKGDVAKVSLQVHFARYFF